MILVVDLCYELDSLSIFEFVHPVADILERSGAQLEIVHYREFAQESLEQYDRIILCGTALKDNDYAKRQDRFSWIEQHKGPMLGICAGMQVISAAFGGRIIPGPAIGLHRIEIIAETPLLGVPRQIEGYHLHRFGATLPEGFLLVAGTPSIVEAFIHPRKPIYGIGFHPEVRNRWILERFGEI